MSVKDTRALRRARGAHRAPHQWTQTVHSGWIVPPCHIGVWPTGPTAFLFPSEEGRGLVRPPRGTEEMQGEGWEGVRADHEAL